MAWIVIGLLRAYKVWENRIPRGCKEVGHMDKKNNVRDDQVPGGYTGGFKGWGPNPTKQTWKSTEHNIVLYAAFMTLSDFPEEPKKACGRMKLCTQKVF